MGASAPKPSKPSGRRRSDPSPTKSNVKPKARRAQPRFKIRFPERDAFHAAQAAEAPLDVDIPIENEKRALLSITVAPQAVSVRQAHKHLETQLTMYAREYGAQVIPDYQYALEAVGAEEDFLLPIRSDRPGVPSLDDVLGAIRAPEAWNKSRGKGVVIAVVDTGIDGTRPEFPPAKRKGGWAPIGEDAWKDYRGHGTMCACIAAATRNEGGEFDGVAPDADIISCRTHFFDSELATIYDFLIDRVEQDGMLVVATNSFGIRTGSPPPPQPDSDFIPALEEAIQKDIKVFFSAGNYHKLALGLPNACKPNSIWSYKCRDDVMVAGTAKLNGDMWFYSSRGPGQVFGQRGTNHKPDVTAPTPANGRILYGTNTRVMPDGWGTSGACPQVAGLAALLLAEDRSLTHTQLFDRIRNTSRTLGKDATCQGSGQIDCAAALAVV